MIDHLINKTDTFEIVRDKIAAILLTECANQKARATAAGKDPKDWDFRVFQERSNAWEEFRGGNESPTPIVNILFDSMELDTSAGNTVEWQKYTSIYHMDIYVRGVAKGQQAGDQDAALRSHKALRLVRNILMASRYTYLGLQGTVWGRSIPNIQVFRPDANDDMAQNIIGARIVFRVVFTEVSPQATPVTLEAVGVELIRRENGEVLLALEYPYDGD